MPDFRKFSIVIPVYNEEKTIAILLDKIKEVKLSGGESKEIVIVNDCSSDNTEKVIRDYMASNPDMDINFSSLERNRGKGAAMKEGIKKVTGEFMIIQDADLEYDPVEYDGLLEPVRRGDADMVYGSRYMGGKPHRLLFFWHTIGNKTLTFFFNLFANLNMTDMLTCYKLFRTEMVQSLNLIEERFGFDVEVTAKMSRVPGVRIYEVGIAYYGRGYEEGKKLRAKDAFRIFHSILKYNLWAK